MNLDQQSPAFLPTTSSANRKNLRSLIFASLLFGLYLRVLTGAFLPSASQAATLLLGVFCILAFSLVHALPRATLVAVLGLLMWIVTGGLSLLDNAPLALPRLAETQLVTLVIYAAFLNAMAVSVTGRTALDSLSRFLAGFVVLGFVLSTYQIATGHGFVEASRPHIQRAFGTDVHPVPFSLQTVLAIAGMEIIRTRLQIRMSAGRWWIYAMAAASLGLTLSRTGWFIAVIIFGSMTYIRSPRAIRITVIPVLLVLVGFGAYASGRFDDLFSLGEFFENYDLTSGVFDYRFVDNSVSWRIANWSIGLIQALERPWFGYGPGQAVAVSEFSLQMHNLFLEAFIETGIFGLLAAIVTVVGFGRSKRPLDEPRIVRRELKTMTRLISFAFFLNIMLSNSMIGQTMTVFLLIIVRVVLDADIQNRTVRDQSI